MILTTGEDIHMVSFINQAFCMKSSAYEAENRQRNIRLMKRLKRTVPLTILFFAMVLSSACDSDKKGSDNGDPGTVTPSSPKAITAFSLTDPVTAVTYQGTINEDDCTISFSLPYSVYENTYLNFAPAITHSGKSISPPSEEEKNFYFPVIYTVTAEDGSTRQYTVNVTLVNTPYKNINSFYFADSGSFGLINEDDYTIAVTVPEGTDPGSLTPSVTHTGAGISPASGTAQDFSGQVTYRVTAEDGSIRDFTVTVTVADGPIGQAVVDPIFFGDETLTGSVVHNSIMYISYMYPNHITSQMEVKVRAFNAVTGVWSNVGSGPVFGKATKQDLAVDRITGKLYCASFHYQSKKLSIASFNGTGWEQIGEFDHPFDIFDLAVDDSSVPYLALHENASPYRVMVKRYVAGNWENVGEPYLTEGIATGASLALHEDTVYIAYCDNVDTYKTFVKKYTPGPGALWETVGGGAAESANTSEMSFSFSGSTPYLFLYYRDPGTGFWQNDIKFFNGTEWLYLDRDSSSSVRYGSSIFVENEDSIYLAYADGSGALRVYHYNGTERTAVGTGPLTGSQTENISLHKIGDYLYITCVDYTSICNNNFILRYLIE